MAKVSTNISLDEDLKKEAQALFAEFGLDLTTAITVFLKQSVREGRIPFEIAVDRPNRKTIRAMKEGDKMMAKFLKDPKSVKTYDNINDLMEALLK